MLNFVVSGINSKAQAFCCLFSGCVLLPPRWRLFLIWLSLISAPLLPSCCLRVMYRFICILMTRLVEACSHTLSLFLGGAKKCDKVLTIINYMFTGHRSLCFFFPLSLPFIKCTTVLSLFLYSPHMVHSLLLNILYRYQRQMTLLSLCLSVCRFVSGPSNSVCCLTCSSLWERGRMSVLLSPGLWYGSALPARVRQGLFV